VRAAEAAPVSLAEADALFADLVPARALVLAVSGGPDSTALLILAARWHANLKRGPKLLAVTVDHGLRPESAREARAAKRLAVRLGVRHRTLRWRGRKPATGVQEAARAARYRLLTAAARAVGARHILVAHTLDDQAETVLIRLFHGSGLSGLAAMARESPLNGLTLLRPLLEIPKARLMATLAAVGTPFVDDPSNCDPRFLRVRVRALMPIIAAEGLTSERLARLAGRLRRADAAIEAAVDHAATTVSVDRGAGRIAFDAAGFASLPEEVALRLLGRAVDRIGIEGPVELGKLEALLEGLLEGYLAARSGTDAAPRRVRRTLAGALITLAGGIVQIEPAPPRRAKVRKVRSKRPKEAAGSGRKRSLTE
jgi:tRNA(Ile)-lysidine synthase